MGLTLDKTARREGFRAYYHGKRECDNPYRDDFRGSALDWSWTIGYREAKRIDKFAQRV